MERDRITLLLMSVLMLVMASAGSVKADSGATGAWAWSGDGQNLAFSVNIRFNEAGIPLPGNGSQTFNLLTTTGYEEIINDGQFLSSNIIKISGDDVYIGSNSYKLVSSSKFSFAFSDGNGGYNQFYSWTSVANGTGKEYTLTSSVNTMSVKFTTASATPSAVPIPGTALLLGSSLLGLVGIGSRRKKA